MNIMCVRGLSARSATAQTQGAWLLRIPHNIRISSPGKQAPPSDVEAGSHATTVRVDASHWIPRTRRAPFAGQTSSISGAGRWLTRTR